MIEAIFIIFIFGMIAGSFLNVLILRLPKNKAITGRSKCPNCKHALGATDLIPVFSFLLLGGKCRYCKQDISRRYFYIELISGLLFVFGYLVLSKNYIAGLPATTADILVLIRYFFIASVLLAIFVIDFEHFVILDKLVLPATLALFGFNFAIDYFSQAVFASGISFLGLLSGIGLFLVFGFIYFISAGRWIGFGDVKFAVFLGIATPFPLIFVNVFLAFFLGAIAGIILLATGRKKLKSELPFGTFLSASAFITILFGEQILNWYVRMIGLR